MRQIGRYVLHEQIASGGMAAVHLGRIVGAEGFSRTVAIKRLHPHVAATPGALEMFIDEAHLSARVRHRNIVATLDVVREQDELFLVMEYIHGVQLSVLERRAAESGSRIPLPIVSALMLDTLAGLEAVHVATDEAGKPLAIVHRDVSPQNIIVASDGTARVLDFGIAKAAVRLQTTREDQLKGKLRFMAPEQFLDEELDGRTDQFATGAVLWGLLTNRRLFEASNDAGVVAKVLEGVIVPPSRHRPDVPPALDAVVARALKRARTDRYASCQEMAVALRAAVPPATPDEVWSWVESQVGDEIRVRTERLSRLETGKIASLEMQAAGDERTETETQPRIASASDREPSRGPRQRKALVSITLVIAAVTASAFLMRTRSPTARAESNAAVAPSLDVPSVTSSSPPAPLPTIEPAPPPPSASETAPPLSASAARSIRAPAKTPTRKRSPCAQMYTVDSDGIRRVKPECL